jgi:DNA-binding MarR family transcriptional regulator
MAKFNLDKSVGHLLRRAQQFSFDMYAKEVGTDSLTPRQFAVLQAVAENPGLSQTDLVKRTGIDRSTLADMISRMLKKGLLARQRTKADARANSVSVTPAGRRAMNQSAAQVMRADTAVLKAVPKAQQSAFIKALAAISDHMDGAGIPAKRKTAAKTRSKRRRSSLDRTARSASVARRRRRGSANGRQDEPLHVARHDGAGVLVTDASRPIENEGLRHPGDSPVDAGTARPVESDAREGIAVLAQERLGVGRIVLVVDAVKRDAGLVAQRHQLRMLDFARPAPRRPEIDHRHAVAPEIRAGETGVGVDRAGVVQYREVEGARLLADQSRGKRLLAGAQSDKEAERQNGEKKHR